MGSSANAAGNDAKLMMDIITSKAVKDLNLDTNIKTHGTAN